MVSHYTLLQHQSRPVERPASIIQNSPDKPFTSLQNSTGTCATPGSLSPCVSQQAENHITHGLGSTSRGQGTAHSVQRVVHMQEVSPHRKTSPCVTNMLEITTKLTSSCSPLILSAETQAKFQLTIPIIGRISLPVHAIYSPPTCTAFSVCQLKNK